MSKDLKQIFLGATSAVIGGLVLAIIFLKAPFLRQ
jgi:hypothetical protein